MPQDFLATYTPLANDIAEHTGLDPTVVLGIIDAETGGGVHVKSNNIFGISPGGKVASYPDVQTAANTFIDLMQTPRYRAVGQLPDPAAQAQALVRAGYNTANPQYASIIATKAAAFAKQVGYQDPPAAGNTNTPPAQQDVGIVPDEVLRPGSVAAPASTSAKPTGGANPDADALITELGGSKPTTAPATPTTATQSANPDADALITELNRPVEHGAVGGAKGKPPAKPGAAPPEVDEFGNVIATSPAYTAPTPEGTTAARNALRGVVMAGEGLTPPSMQPAPGALRRVLGAAYEGGHNAPDASGWAPGGVELGRYIVNPLLATAGAAFRGGQQFLAEATEPIGRDLPLIGHPGLGRDVAAFPEAFPTGAGEFHPLQPTAAEARTKLGRQVTLEEIKDAMRRADEAAPATAAYTPSDRPPSTEGPGPADRRASTAQPPPGGTTGLQNLGQAGQAIGDNLRDMLWGKLQKGDTTELGKPSRILIDAKAAMDDGAIKTRADFDAWTQTWGAERRAEREGGGPGGDGGKWRSVQEGEVFDPGRRFRMNQTTGKSEVLEPDLAETGGPVGADVTRGAIPDQTRIERASNIRKDVSQTAEERAGPGQRDDNVYYQSRPGRDQIPPRIGAHRDFSPQTALDHKYYMDKDPEYRAAVKRNIGERDKEMWDDLRQEMGDEITTKQLEDARKEYTPEKMGVFKDEKPVDPALAEAYRAHFAEELAKFEKNDQVRPILQKAYEKLFDKNGNMETLPSRLQQVRDNMRSILEQKAGGTDLSRAVASIERELTDLTERLNPVMQSGASKWDEWRAKWAEMSRPIDRQKFLQQYAEGRSKSPWNKDTGDLDPHKVQQMLTDIANAHSDYKIHTAHSLTDEQIQKIVNIRNEKMTERLTRLQAATPNSSTHQLLERGLKEKQKQMNAFLQQGIDMAMHGAGVAADQYGIHGLNFAYGVAQAARTVRRDIKSRKAQAAFEEQVNALKDRLLSTQVRDRNALQP